MQQRMQCRLSTRITPLATKGKSYPQKETAAPDSSQMTLKTFQTYKERGARMIHGVQILNSRPAEQSERDIPIMKYKFESNHPTTPPQIPVNKIYLSFQ